MMTTRVGRLRTTRMALVANSLTGLSVDKQGVVVTTRVS